MHLRSPSSDRGVQSFLWALTFFVILYFGMVLVQFGKGTSLVVALSVAIATFVFVRLCGADDRTGRR